ncbi:unnamed protein product [Nippostrongylus brasiliensis]|uniref:Zinc metalloproteinase nas-14 (inferred by orthology to a C. elegans protein) n=1 Tax=Nippostrongylus brasiliensis TaxID=27835 RepID=A0A158R190_NIPBR|nr:unnamed protein product [Nippostrongylus brasiliensis]
MLLCVVLAAVFTQTTALATVSIPNEDAKLVKNRFDDYAEKFLLPEDFANAELKPVDIPSEALLDAVQNSQLFEGDIVGMPSADDPSFRRLRDDPSDFNEDAIFGRPYHSALNLVTYPEKLWTDGQVPYMLEEGMTNECSSYVGRAGGNQTVSLEIDKCFSKLAFSRNGKPTIVPKKPEAEVGQRYKLSEIDSKKVNKLYKCGDYSTTTPAPTTIPTTTTTATTTTTTWVPFTSRTRPGRTRVSFLGSTKSSPPSHHISLQVTPRRTTKTTTTRTTPSTPTTTTTSRKAIRKRCEDLNAHCGMWEQLGHCQHSTKYMSHYCRKSCGMCDGNTVPTTTEKPYGNKKGRGRGGKKVEEGGSIRQGGKKITEKKTKETSCMDKNLFCGYWAKIGECNSESKFMKIFCKASCGKC